MKTKQKQIQSGKKTPLHAKVRRSAKKALVPHKGNDYRPHLIRARGLIAVLVIALAAQVFYGFATTGHLSILGKSTNIQTDQLLKATNKERENLGLGDLTLNEALTKAASLKAADMFTEQYWAHVSPSGIQPWKWFGDVHYDYSYAGENLAKNYPTATATVGAWMGSETHRDNILKKEYVDVGFAIAEGELNGENTTLVVALYGAPSTVGSVKASSSENVSFLAPGVASSSNPLTNFGSALTALSPVTIGVLILLAVVALVGAAAHHYRSKLPKAWRKSWRVHHGMYTFVGMITLGILIIIATGGGAI